MKEILTDVYHWTARHPRIDKEVSSYWVESSAAVIDPMLPAEGLEWFEGRVRPQRVILSCRHHYRDTDEFIEAFGLPVLCPEPGLHEFDDNPAVEGYDPGERVAAGILALNVHGLSDDDFALFLDTGDGALLFADGLINEDGVGFVPDHLMGDDPEGVKVALRASLRALLDRPFDNLLFAHGHPIIGGAKAALREFLDEAEPGS